MTSNWLVLAESANLLATSILLVIFIAVHRSIYDSQRLDHLQLECLISFPTVNYSERTDHQCHEVCFLGARRRRDNGEGNKRRW